jgi:pimeloyl-ACP methyl ester carboxylesterase
MKIYWLAYVAVLGGCPSVTVDQNEGLPGPTVEFDPANSIVPFPNNLLLDPTTGKISLPEQCNESPSSMATRVGVLDKLDGFGTYETAIAVTFTEAVDVASLDGRVVLYERVHEDTVADPTTAISIPVVAVPGTTIRYTDHTNIKACTGPKMVDQVAFVPTLPLHQKSTYTVALLDGIKTAGGAADFRASYTWSLIRDPEPVVVLDDAGNVIVNRTPLDPQRAADKTQLAGLDLLWKAHHSAIKFLADAGHDSSELLLAFEFNTQTTTDPLDPGVASSPAASPVPLPLLGNTSTATAVAGSRMGLFAACSGADTDTQCFLRVLLGISSDVCTPGDAPCIYAAGTAVCAAAGCAAINDVLGSLVLSKQYTSDTANALYTGTGAMPIPGAWTDPLTPAVVHAPNTSNPLASDPQAQLGAIVLIPQTPAPAAGYPTVIFQHGITRARTDVLAVAGGLASKGFAVVAIDALGHGSRAIRISNAAPNCSDVNVGIPGPRPDLGPDPTAHPECYAPVLSPDLGATRDGFRQTVLDIHQLVTSLAACGTTNCGKLKVDPTRILYVGHSLIGGNLGTVAVGATGIKAAVLDAAGVGWFDILENTKQTAKFQCPLVDALIDAGVVMGDKFDPQAGTGLCTTDAWKTMPGYQQFAGIARWILDPAEPANYGDWLAPKSFLIQRIHDDDVLPNFATENLGLAAEQIRGDASCGVPIGASIVPSSVLLAAPTESQYLDYLTVLPGDPACPPGNTFGHGSLLQPLPSVTSGSCNPATGAACDGTFATVRLQTDAIYFLLNNG